MDKKEPLVRVVEPCRNCGVDWSVEQVINGLCPNCRVGKTRVERSPKPPSELETLAERWKKNWEKIEKKLER